MAEEYTIDSDDKCRIQELEPCLDNIAIDQKCIVVAKPGINTLERESDKDCDTTSKPEIGRDLCRIGRDGGKYGGYRIDILTENLTERDKAVLICYICQGIMKDPCVSDSGGQFCKCCGDQHKQTQHIPVSNIINSLKCSCPLIERGCKWLGTLKDCENHLDACGYVYERCKLKCGVVLGRDRLRIHEKECIRRVVKCDHCEKGFKSCELNEHLDKCPRMEVSCGLLCGTKVEREDMEDHLAYDCGLVQETCELGCGVKLTRDELTTHVKNTCVQREIECEHCHVSIKFCDIAKHLDECPQVKVPCEQCSVEKCRQDIPMHIQWYCLETEIECMFARFKCLEQIKRKDMDKHLEEKRMKHLELKLTAMEDSITKQSQEIDRLNESIEKHRKEQKKEISTEEKNCKKRIDFLYIITDTTMLAWRIEDVISIVRGHDLSESEQYQVAEYSFSFRFRPNRDLSIAFPGTAYKHDRPFIAKIHIALSLNNTINSGITEVKQKDITRGCERKIASISKEVVEKYSQRKFPGDTKKELTLWIYLTMQ